jgi:cytochrome c oxidase subunit III
MSSTTYPSVRAAATAKVRSAQAEASRSGIWVAICTITMSFMAFISALYVRQGASADWTHLVLPRILYLNTLALLTSSATLEMARRALAIGLGTELDGGAVRKGLGWLSCTLALGLLFVAGQYEAWRQLAAQGLYLATNANSSFYYVLTAMHGLHLLGGIAAMLVVISRLLFIGNRFRRSTFESTAIYWHFMGVLWLYLLLVLRTKL